MVVLQIINKLIKTSDMSLIINNNLVREMFLGYEDEYDFILDHYTQYNQVPDKETFLSNFQNFDFFSVL